MKVHWGLYWIQRTWDLNHMKSRLRTIEVDGKMQEVLFTNKNKSTENKVVAIMESACDDGVLAPQLVDVLYWDAEGAPSLLRDVPVLKIWDAIEVIHRGGRSKYYAEGENAESCGLWYDQSKVFEAMVG